MLLHVTTGFARAHDGIAMRRRRTIDIGSELHPPLAGDPGIDECALNVRNKGK